MSEVSSESLKLKDHLQTASALDDSNLRLRMATQAADMFAWEMDFTLGQISWAGNAASVIGCSPERLTKDPASGAFFVFPDDRDRINAEFETALLKGDEGYILDFRGNDPTGKRAHWRSHGRFIRDNAGKVIRALGVTQNVTQQKLIEIDLLASAERLTTAEQAAGALIYDYDLVTGQFWRGKGLTRLLGWLPEELAPGPDGWAALRHPADDERIKAMQHTDYIGPDNHYVLEYRVRHKRGHYVWMLDSGRVFRNAQGTIVRVAGASIDISARKSTEANSSMQANLIDLSFEPIVVWHPTRGIVDWNKGAEQLYGYLKAEALGRVSHELLHSVYPMTLPLLLQQLSETKTWTGEIHQRTKLGQKLIVESRQQLIEIDGDAFILETSHDISERREWETRQKMYNRELAHRVKNSFAVLQSILRATLKTSPNPEDFAEAFSGRLQSLVTAQDVLTSANWKFAELGELARKQLAALVEIDRIAITGPEVRLAAEHSVPVALIFNELATNAIKYGALSNAKGTIDLRWHVQKPDDGPRTLFITWREHGGPAVQTPTRRGFGSTLIEKSIPGSHVERQFNTSGLLFTIEFPVPEDAGPD